MKKNRKYHSFWNLLDIEILRQIVKNSNSFSDIFNHFDMVRSGTSYKIIKNRLDKEHISYSHFGYVNQLNFKKEKIPLKSLLVVHESRVTKNQDLKKRLIEEGVKKDECEQCNNPPFWNGIKLTLQLDHINGDNKDNRLENLQILCPNCHSQTNTFSGKNLKNKKKKHFCTQCGNEKKDKSPKGMCWECFKKQEQSKRKFEITKEELQLLIDTLPFTIIGKRYGVSDNTIRKRAKLLGINVPKGRVWPKQKQ